MIRRSSRSVSQLRSRWAAYTALPDDDEATHTERRELLDERQRQAGQIAGLMQEDFGDLCEQQDVERPEQLEMRWKQQDSADCGYQIEQGTSQSVRLRCNPSNLKSWKFARSRMA